jgi:hypothetical protein
LLAGALTGEVMSFSRRGEPMRRGGMGGSSGRTWRWVLQVEVRRGRAGGVGMVGVESRSCGEDMCGQCSRVVMYAVGEKMS